MKKTLSKIYSVAETFNYSQCYVVLWNTAAAAADVATTAVTHVTKLKCLFNFV